MSFCRTACAPSADYAPLVQKDGRINLFTVQDRFLACCYCPVVDLERSS